jgi:hypothetical protein
MGLFSRVVKGAGIDPEDGEILGEFTWDQKSIRKMHGSSPQWEGRTAQGNLRRMSEKPGQRQARGGKRP